MAKSNKQNNNFIDINPCDDSDGEFCYDEEIYEYNESFGYDSDVNNISDDTDSVKMQNSENDCEFDSDTNTKGKTKKLTKKAPKKVTNKPNKKVQK